MMRLVAGLLVLTTCLGCQYSKKPWKARVPVPEHLYAYSAYELLQTVKTHGYQGEHPEFRKPAEDFFNEDFEFFNAGRNASGTKVIVRDTFATGPAFVFSPGGEAPDVVQNPYGTPYWLDDDGRIVAWVDAEDADRIHLQDGGVIVSRSNRAIRGLDAGGRYYFESVPEEGFVSVYGVSDPDRPLFRFTTENKVASLEVKDDRIYVLEFFGPGWYLSVGVWRRGISQMYRVFEAAGGGEYRQVEQILLPEEKLVVDMDPWSDYVLLTEDDEYTARRMSLFDARTGENIDLGPISMGLPLFLAEDVLGNDRLAKYKTAPEPTGGDVTLASRRVP